MKQITLGHSVWFRVEHSGLPDKRQTIRISSLGACCRKCRVSQEEMSLTDLRT